MPRILTSASDPIDFCRRHFPKRKEAARQYGNAGDAPDDRGNCFTYAADHPPYEGEGYRCDTCGALLTNADE